MTNNNIKELSIQVNLNGLSFCILNKASNSVEYLHSIEFNNKLTPFDVLNRLKSELSANSRFFDSFNAVNVIHQNELSTLVPKALYDEKQKANYLKFNAKILKTDYITHDDIDQNQSVNIYIPYVNINNYIFDTFGEFTYQHSSTVFINSILKNDKLGDEPVMFVNINKTMLEIVVLDKGDIQLFNVFEYHSKEDFIYYILFVFEQLSLDVETTPVKLCGKIANDDELFKLIYTYVRHVDILKVDTDYAIAETDKQEELHHYYLILNAF